MPIHDWTRVSDAVYHNFHLDWVTRAAAALNSGILPSSHFAMNETVELRPEVGFCDMPEPDRPVSHRNWDERLPDAAEQPPRTRYRMVDERRQYACPVITVRDDLHQPAAAVVFVTQQDKETPYRLDALLRLAVGAITRGVHLLIVDLFPPSKRDPQGVHKAIWDRIREEPFKLPPDKPLTLAAYSAGTELVAYVENVAVGDRLPDMPIFLTPDRYVPCPLESTYQASFDVLPAALKEPLLR